MKSNEKCISVTIDEFCMIMSKHKEFIFISKTEMNKLNFQQGDRFKIYVENMQDDDYLYIPVAVMSVEYVKSEYQNIKDHPLWTSFLKTSIVKEKEIDEIIEKDINKVKAQFDDYLYEVGCFKNMYMVKIFCL